MIDLAKIDELAQRLGEKLPPGARQARDDLERQFRAVLRVAFERMDLVSREEFDAQTRVLERTRQKLEALERQVAELDRG